MAYPTWPQGKELFPLKATMKLDPVSFMGSQSAKQSCSDVYKNIKAKFMTKLLISNHCVASCIRYCPENLNFQSKKFLKRCQQIGSPTIHIQRPVKRIPFSMGTEPSIAGLLQYCFWEKRVEMQNYHRFNFCFFSISSNVKCYALWNLHVWFLVPNT